MTVKVFKDDILPIYTSSRGTELDPWLVRTSVIIEAGTADGAGRTGFNENRDTDNGKQEPGPHVKMIQSSKESPKTNHSILQTTLQGLKHRGYIYTV